jgi:beta-lactamase class A
MLSSETLLDLATSCGLATPGPLDLTAETDDERNPSLAVTELRATAPVSAVVNSRLPLYPASMIKLPIAAALGDLWKKGELGRDESVMIGGANITETDALPDEPLPPLAPGDRANLEELAYRMLTRSDNVATNVLFDVLDRQVVTRYARSLGLSGTELCRKLSGGAQLIDDPEWDGIGRNAHPAGDCARLLKLIARRKIPGAKWIEERLFEQRWNDKLSLGLEPGDRFAHKTGETSKVTHDGGILEMADGRRYVVVVYTAIPAAKHNETSNQRFGTFMAELCSILGRDSRTIFSFPDIPGGRAGN